MLRNLIADHGGAYMLAVALFFGAAKGLGGGLLRAIALPYFQAAGAPLEAYHAAYTIALLMPWCSKPLWGHLSDNLPLFGYRKRWYVVLAALLGLSASVALSVHDLSVAVATGLFATVSVSLAICDLLFEASYAERIKTALLSGVDLVGFAWGMMMAGSAIAAVIAGVLGDGQQFDIAFLIAAAPFAILAVAAAANGLRESKTAGVAGTTSARAFAVTLIASSVVLALATASDRPADAVAAAVIAALVVLGAAASTLEPTVFACGFFVFVCEASNLNLIGATDYFYTSECGTNFSYTFYASCTALVASVFGLVGVYLFTKMDDWSPQNTFAVLTSAKVVVSTAEVIQTLRLNRAWGISDHAFFLVGEAALQPVVSMMFFLPIVVLTSRLVVKGEEAITYALLAGLANFGNLFAAAIGSYVTKAYNITECNFDALPVALVVSHMVLPMVVIPLAHLVLPVKGAPTPDHSVYGAGGERPD